jgi:lysophospholipase L1-like esterase
VIHLTPPVFDALPIKANTLPDGQAEYRQPFEGYNEVLDRYAQWLLDQRTEGWEVVDIHGPLNQFLAQRRQQEPAFTFAADGVHPNATGHWLIARVLLSYFSGVEEIGSLDTPEDLFGELENGQKLLGLIQQRQRVLKDAWLTDTGHKRPGMAQGLPLAQAEQRAAEIGEQIRPLLPHLETPAISRDDKGRVVLSGPRTNVVIRYTLDDSEPRRAAGAYLGPFDFPWEGTIRARAFGHHDWVQGPVATTASKALEGWTNSLPASALLPITQNRDWRVYNWAQRHRAVCEAVREGKPTLVFIGDSITHFFGGEPRAPIARGAETWDKYYRRRNALNLGFGWDRTENVLWRLQHGELDGASPKAVVLLIGTNNLETNTADEIVDGIKAVCHELHTRDPQTRILLLAILPRSPKPDEFRAKIAHVNSGLAKLYFDDRRPGDLLENVTFLGIGARFVAIDGSISPELMADFLHPTDKGYAVLAEAIEPTLAGLLGETPIGPGTTR